MKQKEIRDTGYTAVRLGHGGVLRIMKVVEDAGAGCCDLM
jgi:hypothetical protein